MLRSLKQTLDARYFRRNGIQSLEFSAQAILCSEYQYVNGWNESAKNVVDFENESIGEGAPYPLTTTFYEHLNRSPCVVLVPDHMLRRLKIRSTLDDHTKVDSKYIKWLAEKRLGLSNREYKLVESEAGVDECWITAYPNSVLDLADKLNQHGVECLQILPKSLLISECSEHANKVVLISDTDSWTIVVVNKNGKADYIRAHEFVSRSANYLEYVWRSTLQVYEFHSGSNCNMALQFYVENEMFEFISKTMTDVSGFEYSINRIDQLDFSKLFLDLVSTGKL